jgi:hypothetical protein
VPPTVANWVQDYIQHNGSSLSDFDALKLSAYLGSSSNVRSLSLPEKDRIRKLIRLYRNLKFFPESMEGKEIMGWDFFPLEGNSAAPHISVSVNERAFDTRPPLDQLKGKYASYRRERSAILRLEDQLLVKTKGESEAVKKEFSVAVRNEDKNTVIACLMIMARQGALFTALRDNPAWFSAVSEYVQKKYTGYYKPDEIMYAISNFKLEPSATAAISEFLQYILLDKMKLSENEAALVGVEIGQVLGSSYQGIAYGNQETGNFEWSENKIVDNKLVGEV